MKWERMWVGVRDGGGEELGVEVVDVGKEGGKVVSEEVSGVQVAQKSKERKLMLVHRGDES